MPAPAKVEVTARALTDIARVVAFLLAKNPVAAKRLRDAIWVSFEAIRVSPGIGRRLHGGSAGMEVRERVLRFGRSAYVVRYAVEPGAITVLRIHHGREDRG